jgi:hypothetical protein
VFLHTGDWQNQDFKKYFVYLTKKFMGKTKLCFDKYRIYDKLTVSLIFTICGINKIVYEFYQQLD